MSQIDLHVQRISKEDDKYCIRYLKDNQIGKYYSETNEIFVYSQLGGVRVFRIVGDYGGELITAIINELRQREITSPHINKDELIKILEDKRSEALLSK